ncbi:hypothetical protein D3C85_1645980 [compost metagenome]
MGRAWRVSDLLYADLGGGAVSRPYPQEGAAVCFYRAGGDHSGLAAGSACAADAVPELF